MPEERKCPCDAVIEMRAKLEEHEKRLADGNTNFALIQQTLARIESDMTEIKGDIKNIKEKPGRKWEGITSKVTEWAFILLLGYVALQLGLQ